VGDLLAERGDLAGAEEAFARARELGLDPQPGLALLRLAQGKPEAARSAIELALADHPRRPTKTAGLLATMIDIAVSIGDLDAAAAAAEALDDIAGNLGTPALNAMAATARGSVALARGDAGEALPHLRRACAVWQELRLPYETARARARFGIALRRAGNEDDARLELRAARTALERLGAAPDASEVAAELGEPRGLPGGITAREAEVLRLVATGKTNRDIAVELVISEHTVARHLQKIYAKVGVSTRSAATAFAFEHGLT
jgi:ATP/maltotriose-dependent transcriptional regulator MalT